MISILSHFLRSVQYALHGLRVTFRTEQNFRVQIVAAVLVTIAMFLFPLSRSERVFLVLVMMIVLVLELVNTAVEKFVDFLRPRWHEEARIIKDILSGAVLVASVGAFLIGLFIFLPYIV